MAQQPVQFSPQIIAEPQEIGNYLPTGICIGPSTKTGDQTPGFINADSLSLEKALSYGYGNGLLLGPTCTYRICPAPDLLAITPNVLLTGQTVPYKLPLVNSNNASPRGGQYIKTKGGKTFIQMDYPRTVGAVLSGFSVSPNSTNCTVTALVRGIDGWGRKVTTSVTVTTNNPPRRLAPVSQGEPYAQTASALFQVYEVEITSISNVDGGANAAVYFCVGDSFGLPYKMTDIGHIQSYSQWWNQILNAPPFYNGQNGINANLMEWTEVTNSSAVPWYYTTTYNPAGGSPNTYSTTPFQLSFPKVLATGFNPWDQNAGGTVPIIPSATTPDVRGLFSPQNLMSYQYTSGSNPLAYTIVWGDSYGWSGPMTMSYYVPGADVFIWKYSQMMNQYQQAALLDGSVPAGGWNGFGNSFYFNYNGDETNKCEPTLDLLIGETPYSDF